MGRHSRKGPAPKAADSRNAGAAPAANGDGGGRGEYGGRSAYPTPAHGTPEYGTPAHGTPEYGVPVYGTPAHGIPVYGTPAHGVPAYGNTPARTPSYDTPVHGTPAHGTRTDGTPARGFPSVRGGHPEQHEPGGGWGAPQGGSRYGDWRGVPRGQTATMTGGHPVAAPPGPARQGSPIGAGARIPGPRREFVEAFDTAGTPGTPGAVPGASGAPGAVGAPGLKEQTSPDVAPGGDASARPAARAIKGRTVTGIAAAAVTTVLAVVVAGQVTGDGADEADARAAAEADRGSAEGSASRSDSRPTPQRQAPRVPAAPLGYAQLMAKQFPLDPELKGSGDFAAVPGFDKAPGSGEKIRYRIDVEKGLGLDGALFAKAVQQTLNDKRSWARDGDMTFERISSGDPQFVITLASPGTTGVWCAKSDLDTIVGNVSCNSHETERVMINAYRWAQGSPTYGPKAMLAYRQMLINHEVGHRLGHGHVDCRTPGALAPVMQQQTKSLDIDGVRCRPNPWVYPED
ncbi:DUF3152 domain-containing protein [Streptomyces sp. NPDC127084]|uniref:DUF3152 domain-containing protein n=1 Tax=Streptomyces sp. NPDC127084 TaxID=3347133 RepID=UPI00364E766F